MKTDYLRYMRSQTDKNLTPNIYDVKLKYKRFNQTNYKIKPRSFNCDIPSYALNLDRNGQVYICSCNGHLPYSIGSILDFNSFEEIWNNPIAKKLQLSTRSGSTFKFCHLDVCRQPVEFADPKGLNYMYEFVVGIDDSCNLHCPSCRTKLIHYKSGNIYDHRKKCMDKFLDLLSKFNKPALIELGGDGEVFSSKIYSIMVYDYKPLAEHVFTIRTNGTLINQNKLLESQVINQLRNFTISIDAGSEQIYNIVRPPGSWKKLINNLDFLSSNNFKFELAFVLQKNNLYDVQNFLDLAQKYNVPVHITKLENWGTWQNEEQYNDQAVFLPKNKLFEDYNRIINEIKNHPHYKSVVNII